MELSASFFGSKIGTFSCFLFQKLQSTMEETDEEFLRRITSHRGYRSTEDIQRELVDLGAIPGAVSQEPNELSQISLENSGNRASIATLLSQGTTSNMDSQETVLDTQQRATKKRATKVYSKRFFLANRSLFLDPAKASSFTDDQVLVLGQIDKCPREKTNWQYSFKWLENAAYPFPVPESDLRKEVVKNDQVQLLVDEAMKRYDEDAMLTGLATLPRPMEATAPPATIRATPRLPTPAEEAVASIRTSASTISSITHSSGNGNFGDASIASASTSLTNRFNDNDVRLTRNNPNSGYDSQTDDGEEIEEFDDPQVFVEDEDSDVPEESQSERCTIGDMINSFQWCYEAMPDDYVDDSAPELYNGESGNKRNVNTSFVDPFECLERAGLSVDFVSRLTYYSNDYARKYLLSKGRNPRLHGAPWKNIEREEMYRFLGIMLQMSLSPRDGGGNQAYF